jgi:hypothetical protein
MGERLDVLERIAEKYNFDYSMVDDGKLGTESVQKACIYHEIQHYDLTRKEMVAEILDTEVSNIGYAYGKRFSVNLLQKILEKDIE